jgi:hypothetical protein
MNQISHKKSFSDKNLNPAKYLNLHSTQIDPFKSLENSKKHSIMLRPICHKRHTSNLDQITSPKNDSKKVPILKLPQGFNMQSSSTVNKNPCLTERAPRSQLFLPDFNTPRLPLKIFHIEPLNSCRNHSISLSNLNKKMKDQMDRLIRKRERKFTNDSLDFSFGNQQ